MRICDLQEIPVLLFFCIVFCLSHVYILPKLGVTPPASDLATAPSFCSSRKNRQCRTSVPGGHRQKLLNLSMCSAPFFVLTHLSLSWLPLLPATHWVSKAIRRSCCASAPLWTVCWRLCCGATYVWGTRVEVEGWLSALNRFLWCTIMAGARQMLLVKLRKAAF